MIDCIFLFALVFNFIAVSISRLFSFCSICLEIYVSKLFEMQCCTFVLRRKRNVVFFVDSLCDVLNKKYAS